MEFKSDALYISIGNSDDRLMQREWGSFVRDMEALVDRYAVRIYGAWFSFPSVDYQSACWAIDGTEFRDGLILDELISDLHKLAVKYAQESISLAHAMTIFIGPGKATRSVP